MIPRTLDAEIDGLANLNKQILIGNANRELGYLHALNMLTPLEVIDYEE